MRLNIMLAILIALTTACQEGGEKESRVDQLPYYSEATFTPIWELPENFHMIPDFELINQDGKTITQRSFNDKIYVANFFFTSCPGICPQMTSNMAVLQEDFFEDDEVLFLSHSVTPNRDSVEVLQNYAEAKGVISGKWHLVTGDQEEIYKLGRKFYFAEEDLGLEKSDIEFLHTENFILIDKDKHIRGIYNGLNKTSVAQLTADIRTLEKEG